MSTNIRAEQIAGLRELIDWLEAHPAVELPDIARYGYRLFVRNTTPADVAAQLAELRAIGAAIGVEPHSSYGRHVYVQGPTFRGGVAFEAIVCDAEDLFKQQEAERAEQPQDGHVYRCCGKVGRISRHNSWCPGNDITHGGEEVGASAGVTGAPTAPPYATDERPLPRLVHPAPITDPALRGGDA